MLIHGTPPDDLLPRRENLMPTHLLADLIFGLLLLAVALGAIAWYGLNVLRLVCREAERQERELILEHDEREMPDA
jgi:hypothetical protein